METKKILIGGKWVSAVGDFDVLSPYSGEVAANVSQADSGLMSEALASAEASAIEMRDMPAYRLSESLSSISRGIENRKEEFAKTISTESGKPIRYSRTEVERAVATFRFAAGEAERFAGEVVRVDQNEAASGRFGYTRHTPRGVIVGITPFNFPLNLVAHKAAPALASGNAIIIKPSEKTPLTALLLGEVFLECGLPEAALQVVPMELDVLGEMLADDRVKMISFTGSDKVGWMLKGRYPKKAVALELGGNAPVIVDETAEPVDAASRISAGAFSFSGQVCISVQRILVQESVREALTSLLKEKANSLRRGDPLDEDTEISVMISKEAAERTIKAVESAVANGARLICGGKIQGAFVEPTLLTDVDPEMDVVSTEMFAPVAVIEPYDRFQEAVGMANDSRFGLQAGVFSNNMVNVEYAARNLHYGGVMINDVPTFRVDNMPYGGVKESGSGREGVRYAMEEMCEKKMVVSRPQQPNTT